MPTATEDRCDMDRGITRWWQLDVVLAVVVFLVVGTAARFHRFLPIGVNVVWTLAVCASFVLAHTLSFGGDQGASLLGRPRRKPRTLAEVVALRRWDAPFGYVAILVLLIALFREGYTGLFVRWGQDTMFPATYYPSLSSSPGWAIAFAITAVVSAPIVEEFAFRGWMQPALVRRFGATAGIISTSAIFALAHTVPWRPNWFLVLPFVVGLAFGLAVTLTRSIWTSILAHAVANGLGVLLIAGVDPALWIGRTALGVYASLALILVSTVAFVLVCRRLAGLDNARRENAAGTVSDPPNLHPPFVAQRPVNE